MLRYLDQYRYLLITILFAPKDRDLRKDQPGSAPPKESFGPSGLTNYFKAIWDK